MPIVEEINEDEPSQTSQEAPPQGSQRQPGGSSALQRLFNYMLASRIEALLWLTRLFTVFFTINYFLPVFGWHPYSSYQKVLISSAATSALRLHQRVPHFRFSREYISNLFLEDSAHYLFYSLIFLTSAPASMALMPVFLYAVLHTQNYTKQLLNQVGPMSLMFIRNLLSKIEVHQVNILRFIACSEIFLMPTIVFFLITGQGSFFLPLLYYRFLSLRYSSRRNPYCKQLFMELRLAVETLCSRPQCPGLIKNACFWCISIICRLAPTN